MAAVAARAQPTWPRLRLRFLRADVSASRPLPIPSYYLLRLQLFAPPPLNPRPFPLERDHGGAGVPRHVEGGLRGAGLAHGGHAGVHHSHRRLAVPPRAAYAVSILLMCSLADW